MDHDLVDPAGVVPGSLMPAQTYTEQELDQITGWLLSLRARDLPARHLPKDRVARTLLGETSSPLDGRQAYFAYCSACHGPAGEGRTYGNSELRFPAIGLAGFLDVVTDDFVRLTPQTGRPGRRMPALAGSKFITGAEEGPIDTVLNGRPNTAMQAFKQQLSDTEIAAVITYARNTWGNKASDVQPAEVKARRK